MEKKILIPAVGIAILTLGFSCLTASTIAAIKNHKNSKEKQAQLLLENHDTNQQDARQKQSQLLVESRNTNEQDARQKQSQLLVESRNTNEQDAGEKQSSNSSVLLRQMSPEQTPVTQSKNPVPLLPPKNKNPLTSPVTPHKPELEPQSPTGITIQPVPEGYTPQEILPAVPHEPESKPEITISTGLWPGALKVASMPKIPRPKRTISKKRTKPPQSKSTKAKSEMPSESSEEDYLPPKIKRKQVSFTYTSPSEPNGQKQRPRAKSSTTTKLSTRMQ